MTGDTLFKMLEPMPPEEREKLVFPVLFSPAFAGAVAEKVLNGDFSEKTKLSDKELAEILDDRLNGSDIVEKFVTAVETCFYSEIYRRRTIGMMNDLRKLLEKQEVVSDLTESN